MSHSLTDKSIIISGAGSGIGRATALACAEQGARLVLADIDETSVRETAAMFAENGAQAAVLRVDVRDATQVRGLVRAAVEHYGRLDGAFNSAGIAGTGGKRIADYDEDEWQQIMEINLKGVWLCMKYELQQMLAQVSGCIVNAASIAGLGGSPALPIYSASKHGVVGLTRSAALQYAADGIRVNAVCPGFVETPMMDQITGDVPKLVGSIHKLSPAGRVATAEEVADAVVWLLSDAAAYINGIALPIDGGRNAG